MGPARGSLKTVGCALCGCMVVSWVCCALAQGGQEIDGLDSLLDPLVLGHLERGRIAGAVVIVVKDDAVIFSTGYGHSDVAADRIMTPETAVRIGSITKTLTALSVMQLSAIERMREPNAQTARGCD